MNVTEYNSCVDKYLKMVYRISFHYFGNREDAEDVSQDVFLKLYSHNTKFESEEELKAWLIRVTTNTCHSYFRNPFRKRKTEIDEKEIENIVGSSSSEQEIINRKVVMDAVMSLPERYRIVVYLYYYEEYSICQISNTLNIKETTIQTRLSRAREKLKSVLKDCFP
jgi:RNA polymerase sigma-70 factor, ECF subfamily